MRRPMAVLAIVAGVGCGRSSRADDPPRPLSIDQAIEYALLHHPSLRAQAAAEEVSSAQVELARTGYLPQLDAVFQINAGTANVVPGSLFPVRNLPVTSGPPTGRAFDAATFGTAVAVTSAWDVLALQQRMAQVDAALAERRRAHAGTDARRLAIAFAAADAFLAALARAETVKSTQASLERARVFRDVVKALVDQDLRPGTERSRAEAELAVAATQLARAEQGARMARTDLALALGIAGHELTLASAPLFESPGGQRGGSSGEQGKNSRRHPLLVESDAAMAAARAREQAVKLQYLPRLELFAALWVRGSGKFAGGAGAAGLIPDTPNWLTGASLTWPIFDLFAIRARARVETANAKALSAREEEIGQSIQSQVDSAVAVVDGARQIAASTPIALAAARTAERQITARYQAGLSSVVEVADAQRILAQAEIDDAVARLAVWSGLLLVARAAGDLGPFVAEVHAGGR